MPTDDASASSTPPRRPMPGRPVARPSQARSARADATSGGSDVGAVLRRSPPTTAADPDGSDVAASPSAASRQPDAEPGGWRIRRLPPSQGGPAIARDPVHSRPAPPTERRSPSGGYAPLRSGIVDNTGDPTPSRPLAPDPDIVDVAGWPDDPDLSSAIVDTPGADGLAPWVDALPGPGTSYRSPAFRKADGAQSGPTGPDAERIRRLRQATRDRLAARSKERGVDPGAGSTRSASGLLRSEKTHNQYLERGRSLVRRYARERDLGTAGMDNVNPIEFANWLFSLRPTLSASSWRPYRQSAKAILETMPLDDAEQAIAMIDADVVQGTALDQPGRSRRRDPETREDGVRRREKEKRFPKADFDKTVNYLRYVSRSKLSSVLIDWLHAGVATGLRPIEWRATDLEVRDESTAPSGRSAWLYVLNAKATNGRGNDKVRTLDLSHFGDATIEAVRRMSDRGGHWQLDGSYDAMQSQCSQLLYSVCERIFPARRRTYALYSLRHQFIANAKSFHRPEAVAALAGHAVTDTAGESYAKKVSSWGPEEIADRADPVPDEVATVRQRLRFFEDRQRMLAAAGLPESREPGRRSGT